MGCSAPGDPAAASEHVVPSAGACFPPIVSARGDGANGRRVLFVAGDERGL